MPNNDFSVSVKANFDELMLSLNAAQRVAVREAAVNALNRAISAEQTEAIKIIKTTLALTTPYARREFKKHNANKGTMTATLIVDYKPIQASHFPIHPGTHGSGKGKGSPLQIHEYTDKGFVSKDKAFVMTKGSSHAVIKRVGTKRYPTKQLYGPAVAPTIDKPTATDAINAAGEVAWLKNFKQQVAYRLSKLGFTITW